MRLWQVGWICLTSAMKQRLLIRLPSEMQETIMMGRGHTPDPMARWAH